MRKYFKPLMIVAAMTTSVSALAIQKDITVNASVDSQLDMTRPITRRCRQASICSICLAAVWKAIA